MNLGGVVLAPGLLYAKETTTKVENTKKNDKKVPKKVVN